MPRVVIATTMWSDVREEIGVRREHELKRDFWKDMLAHGCRTERFKDTYESAWRIIGSLAEKERAQVLLPSEIVDSHLKLNETQAGITLDSELEKLIRERKDAARRLREQAQKHDNKLIVQELNQRTMEIERKIRQTVEDLRRMNSCRR